MHVIVFHVKRLLVTEPQALFVLELQQAMGSSGSGFTAMYYPMVAGYEYEPAGRTVYGHQQFQNPPNKPVLFALTNKVAFRQAAVGFDVRLAPGDGTVEYVGGHVKPSVVVAIPNPTLSVS